MSKNTWRILLVALAGSTLAAALSTLLKASVNSADGVFSGHSYLRGTLLHEAPFIFSVLPAFVALAGLAYVGGMLLVRGRVGLPERPRLVTWLILANFLAPVGSLAVLFTSLWLLN